MLSRCYHEVNFLLLSEYVQNIHTQLLLDAVFIIRGFNDEQLREHSSLIVVISMFASLISITGQYIWYDGVSKAFKDADADFGVCNCPCINPRFIVRSIWRFMVIVTRFCCFALNTS